MDISLGEGRRLATKGTKSTKGTTMNLDLPFVLFVPFVANLLPSPLLMSIHALHVPALIHSHLRRPRLHFAPNQLSYQEYGIAKPQEPAPCAPTGAPAGRCITGSLWF